MRLMLMAVFAALMSLPVKDRSNMSDTTPGGKDDAPLLTFGLIADPQYCDCPAAGTRFYRSSLQKLTEAAAVFKREKVSFIVSLGDLIDRDFNSFTPVLEILRSTGITTWHCIGNHDYSVGEFKGRIPIPENGKKGYYSFSRENFRFIFLNGNEISTYSSDDKEVINKAKTLIRELTEAGAVNAFEWNGGISADQTKWLEAELRDASVRHEKALIFCHFPVAPENIHNLLNCNDLLPVVENPGNTVAWFAGHNHEGNYARPGRVHHITMKGMVETPSVATYSIVSLFADRIEIEGYGNEESRTCYFN